MISSQRLAYGGSMGWDGRSWQEKNAFWFAKMLPGRYGLKRND
jgi:hypothetical protein